MMGMTLPLIYANHDSEGEDDCGGVGYNDSEDEAGCSGVGTMETESTRKFVPKEVLPSIS
jgi:hypothetical protein